MDSTKLNSVTLFSLVGSEKYLDQTLKAINRCKKLVDFGSIKLASCIEFNDDDIEYIPIAKLSQLEYSYFLMYNLDDLIETDFCLTIQSDGFIVDESYWNEDFLKFDYIGAPWTNFNQENCVGNGGFSLRSKKFLNCCKKLEYKHDVQFQPHIPAGKLVTPEDWFCCVHSYKNMVSMGVKFADIHTAYSFSVEHPSIFKTYNRSKIETYKSFGFHGAFNKAGMELI